MTTDRLRFAPLACALVFALAGCDGASPRPSGTTAPPDAAAAPKRAATSVRVEPWTLPTSTGQQPDLSVAPDGSLLLSWTEGTGEAQRLRVARWSRGRWDAPADVASGPGIGNTADTPHVRQTPDGALWAAWLRKIGEGHARDIVLARSADGGRTWSTPVPVNTDGTPTEHGFASLWPEGTSSLGVAWLDGREKAGDAHGHDMHAMHGGGDAEAEHATMLRTAVFDARLARRDESAIDTTTCDCCQTDVAVLADGPRLVYRDRAPGEIRDIAMLSRGANGWSAPRRVHADDWRMPGCPVNGPAVAGAGRDVAVAWYTMRADVPTVRFARSGDGGTSFGNPIDLASAADVLGRVDVAIDATGAWVTWLTEDAGAQVLHAAHASSAAAAPDVRVDVARLAGRGRGTGWPRLVVAGDGARIVWTDLVDGRPVLKAARFASR